MTIALFATASVATRKLKHCEGARRESEAAGPSRASVFRGSFANQGGAPSPWPSDLPMGAGLVAAGGVASE